jgi:glutathione S-transferase
MPIRFYFDLLSQPSRALYIFMRLNNVPFEAKSVALRKGEHQGPEYKQINPFGLVPVIDDDNFKLTESAAILKYIIRKFDLPDHWFPQSNLKKQARIEEYLHWHHFNTRANCAQLFQQLFIIPKMTGQPINQDRVRKCREGVTKMVGQLESYFLKSNPYIGGDELSIADLLGICELMQLYACQENGLYEKSPVVKSWMEKVKQETNPYFDEAHKVVYRTHEVYSQVSAKL